MNCRYSDFDSVVILCKGGDREIVVRVSSGWDRC
jgi:hypothetical protein